MNEQLMDGRPGGKTNKRFRQCNKLKRTLSSSAEHNYETKGFGFPIAAVKQTINQSMKISRDVCLIFK